MEAIFAPSSTEQSFSPYNKHRKNHPNTRDNFNIYRSTTDQNLAPMMNYIIHSGNGGGFLFAPPLPPPQPSISFSYPPPSPAMMYPNNNQLINRRQSPPQPPLLPLPISKPGCHNSLPSPMVARKSNRKLKKSKYPISKRDEVKQLAPQSVTIPKAVSKVLSSLPPSSFSSMAGSNSANNIVLSIEHLERFSGSVFTPSPHPSSLPLPKFSVKPKLSCTAEAGAARVDSGATDNLR